jgi:hypothetical protein
MGCRGVWYRARPQKPTSPAIQHSIERPFPPDPFERCTYCMTRYSAARTEEEP